jgi:hypothetical protein
VGNSEQGAAGESDEEAEFGFWFKGVLTSLRTLPKIALLFDTSCEKFQYKVSFLSKLGTAVRAA